MELKNNMMTDDQAISMMKDFVDSQEKLRSQRARAVEQLGGDAPRYTHYTSADSALETLTNLLT